MKHKALMCRPCYGTFFKNKELYMLKKNRKSVIGVLIMVSLLGMVSSNCKKDNDEIQGNCVIITKSDIDADTISAYSASGYIVPKRYCNATALGGNFTLSLTEALSALIADYDAAISELSAAECSTAKNSVETLKNNATTINIESSADAATPKCATVGNIGGYTTFCMTQTEIDTFKNNRAYHWVSNVLLDMAPRLTYLQTVQMLNVSTTKFTADAIAAMQPDDMNSLAIKQSAAYLGYSYAVYEGAATSACRKTILDRNPDLKAIIARMNGFDAELGTTTATVTSVLASIHCQYGDDWVEPTADPGDGSTITQIGTCPDTYPQW